MLEKLKLKLYFLRNKFYKKPLFTLYNRTVQRRYEYNIPLGKTAAAPHRV